MIGGAAAVPANAVAVVMNITATGGTANSYLTVYPAGDPVPNASNVNFAAGQTIPNLATVKVGVGGLVGFANAAGSTHVIADLVGYFNETPADLYNPVTPTRILDSRGTNGGWDAQLAAGTPRTLSVRGVAGIPTSADAVMMNVTVTGGTAASFVTVYPAGTAVPNASNVNFAAGETIPNLVSVKIGVGGQVEFANAIGSTDVVADVVGYFDPNTGDEFHALAPARILDSRGSIGAWNAPVNAGSPRGLQVTGAGGVPADATSIIGNTTVTGGTANSFLTVYPSGTSVPNASNVNFAAGQTIPNLTAVKLGTNGQIAFANAVGSTNVIFDVVGYFVASCKKQYGQLTAPTVRMSVVNSNATYLDSDVYVALTGVVLNGYSGWGANPCNLVNHSVRLSTLPTDPTDPSGHTHYFDLGEGIGSGLLWISLGSPIDSGLPTIQPSFDTTTYRFANVEFAYPGQGDITNVDQFSFPVNLETLDASGNTISTRAYSGTTCEIRAALKTAVDNYNTTYIASGDLPTSYAAAWDHIEVDDAAGHFVRVVAPKQRAKQPTMNGTTPNPYSQGWPSMIPYLDSMKGQSIKVKGLFSPAAGTNHVDETGWYDYSGAFDPVTGELTLTGTIASPIGGSTIDQGRAGLPMSVALSRTQTSPSPGLDGLATGIYDQNSQYFVNDMARNGFTNGTADPAAPNDVYNTIYRDLTSAFTYGYWGGVYGDDNKDFWGVFTPPNAPSGGQPGFDAARAGNDKFLAYNLYSQIMFNYSDNYNIPYGENYGSGAPNRNSPLLTVPGGGTWQMTIGADGPVGCLP